MFILGVQFSCILTSNVKRISLVAILDDRETTELLIFQSGQGLNIEKSLTNNRQALLPNLGSNYLN